MTDKKSRTVNDVAVLLGNADSVQALAPEDLLEIVLSLTELGYPMLRNDFKYAALDRLTKWVSRVDQNGSEADQKASQNVSRTIVSLYYREKFYRAAVSLLPEFCGLKNAAFKKSESFQDREAESLACLMLDSLGPARASQAVPDMFREVSYAELAEKRNARTLSALIRRAAEPQIS
ncbi:MAG: hypothetical protein JWO78_1724 [Micavibrio sp.]|nr:hypothetical protein [Micavibrio sp.]